MIETLVPRPLAGASGGGHASKAAGDVAGRARPRRVGRLFSASVVITGMALAAACSGSSGGGPPKTTPTLPTTGAPTTTAVPLVPSAVSSAPSRPSIGCQATSPVPAGRTNETLSIEGTTRQYFRYTPPGVQGNTPIPIVVDIHGLGSNANEELAVTQFEQQAATEHFVVLTPQGAGNPPGWDTVAKAASPDVDFLTAMLKTVESQECIDTARVYSTGISNGGIMSSLLACRMADQFAAIGLVSGIRHPDTCSPGRPVPIMVFWGKQDVVLPFYGGLGDGLKAALDPAHAPTVFHVPTSPPADLQGFPPVEDVVGQWAGTDGCNPTPAVSPAGSDVEQRIFAGCRGDAVIRFYVVSDGGHTWPGSKVMETFNDPTNPLHKILGTATDQVDATKLIWAFFKGYALRS